MSCRELIRTGRRLVEINSEQLRLGRVPRLDDLAARATTSFAIAIPVMGPRGRGL